LNSPFLIVPIDIQVISEIVGFTLTDKALSEVFFGIIDCIVEERSFNIITDFTFEPHLFELWENGCSFSYNAANLNESVQMSLS